MAKDNLFLGMARGAVGDVVFSRLNGQQVARARNRAPRNPMTVAQMVQRIIMNTASKAYSMMQEITNHSFEGFSEGQNSQQEFMRVNVAWLRELCAEILAEPTEEAMNEYGIDLEHFSFKGDYLPVINPYVVSMGTLPGVDLVPQSNRYLTQFYLGTIAASTTSVSYQQVVDALGLQRGDQLTFLMLVADPSNTEARSFAQSFRFARVILEPASGNMTDVFLSSETTGIQSPNDKNETTGFSLALSEGTYLGVSFEFQGVSSDPDGHAAPAFSGIIVSRENNSKWLRSACVLRKNFLNNAPFGEDDLYGAWLSYQRDSNSGLYLNQAQS